MMSVIVYFIERYYLVLIELPIKLSIDNLKREIRESKRAKDGSEEPTKNS